MQYAAKLFALTVLFAAACSSVDENGVCGSEDASECAVQEFKAHLGAGSKADIGSCMETLMASTFTTKPANDMDGLCKAGNVVGCMSHYSVDGATILVADSTDGQSKITAAHEMMHVLLQCVSGDPDAHHRKAAWTNIR
jgi:hypothetical protein